MSQISVLNDEAVPQWLVYSLVWNQRFLVWLATTLSYPHQVQLPAFPLRQNSASRKSLYGAVLEMVGLTIIGFLFQQ